MKEMDKTEAYKLAISMPFTWYRVKNRKFVEDKESA